MKGIYLPPPKKKYVSNKTNGYHFDSTVSMHLLEQIDFGPKNKESYREKSVIRGMLAKFDG